jgi:hypothetical protein
VAEKAMVMSGYHPWQLRLIAAKHLKVSPLEVKRLTVGEVVDLNLLLDVAVEHSERAAKEKPQ